MQIRRKESEYWTKMIESVHGKKPNLALKRKMLKKKPVTRSQARVAVVKRVAIEKAPANQVNPANPKPAKMNKKIAKKKKSYAERKKEEKRQEREEKSRGNLLKQLTMIHQRQERMDQDKEHYCLIEWEKDFKDKRYRFKMVKDDEPYVLKIDVKQNYDTVCNCFDWRIRCRNFMIPCKHIAYIFTKILGYELFEYYDNKILKPKLFEQAVKDKLVNKKQFNQNQNAGLADKACPVCFSDFDGYNRNNTVECPDCTNVKHLDCAKVWLEHSVRKVCAICKSDKWRGVVEKKK